MIKASKIMRRVSATVILDTLSRAEKEMESEKMPTNKWAQIPTYFLAPSYNYEDSH